MATENQTPQPTQPDADHTVELAARFTIPAAFSVTEADELARSLVERVAAADSDLYREHGPNGTTFNPYISTVNLRSQVVGDLARAYVVRIDWGHGDRCQCHHAKVDHLAPQSLGNPTGRCFERDCPCERYVPAAG